MRSLRTHERRAGLVLCAAALVLMGSSVPESERVVVAPITAGSTYVARIHRVVELHDTAASGWRVIHRTRELTFDIEKRVHIIEVEKHHVLRASVTYLSVKATDPDIGVPPEIEGGMIYLDAHGPKVRVLGNGPLPPRLAQVIRNDNLDVLEPNPLVHAIAAHTVIEGRRRRVTSMSLGSLYGPHTRMRLDSGTDTLVKVDKSRLTFSLRWRVHGRFGPMKTHQSATGQAIVDKTNGHLLSLSMAGRISGHAVLTERGHLISISSHGMQRLTVTHTYEN